MTRIFRAVPAAPPLSEEEMAAVQDMVHTLAADWRTDAALRARVAEGRAVLSERGLDISTGAEARIVANTDAVFHLVLPPDPNGVLMDEDLDGVAAAAQTGAQTAGTASCLGTLPSCISTASSASSTQTHHNPPGQ